MEKRERLIITRNSAHYPNYNYGTDAEGTAWATCFTSGAVKCESCGVPILRGWWAPAMRDDRPSRYRCLSCVDIRPAAPGH